MKENLPRIITRSELRAIVPFTPQYILQLEKQGRFPQRIAIGERRVGWRLSDIEQWITERAHMTGEKRKVSGNE